MTTKRQYTYKIGDRVAERPKIHGIFASKESIQKVAAYRSQRYGTVVGLNIKLNRNGSKRKYLLVKWDCVTTPMEHEQTRICPVSELERLTKEVIVPGE